MARFTSASVRRNTKRGRHKLRWYTVP